MSSIHSFIFEERGLVLIAKNQQFHIKSLGVSVFNFRWGLIKVAKPMEKREAQQNNAIERN